MTHTIRRTLLALGAGVVVQRLAQFVTFVLVGSALGVAGLGVYAQGQALAAVLTVIAGAGIGNLAARALARDPGVARGVVVQALRRRFVIGTALALVAGGVATAASPQPWFWWLCVLQALPAAFDQKRLLDAFGRLRREMALETTTAVLHLLAVLVCTGIGEPHLEALAAIALASRCLYAAGAWATIRRLPAGDGEAPRGTWQANVALGQGAHELVSLGDVWLVALALGDAAAGLYAMGVRLAGAALLPSVQLARLLLPHLLHAAAAGRAARTLGAALRSTLLVTAPIFAGGAVAAEALCRLAGDAFAGAAPALRLLLLAGCLQHVGWQCSNALLARHRDRAYAHVFGWPASLHLSMLCLLPAFVPADAATTSLLAASAAVIGQGVYATAALATTHDIWHTRTRSWWQPLALASLTAAATAAPAWLIGGALQLPLQLLAGASAFGAGLWQFELRGRWRRVGDGLAAASGFGA